MTELEAKISKTYAELDKTTDLVKYADTVLRLLLMYQELTLQLKSSALRTKERHETIAAAALIGEPESLETHLEPILRLNKTLSRLREELSHRRKPSRPNPTAAPSNRDPEPPVELELLHESRYQTTLLTAGLALLGFDLFRH